MASVSRFNGLTGTIAMKAPVQAATLSNITLSGLQTIDSVVLAVGDRVLVKNQTNAVENGIYNASASAWGRAADFDGVDDVVAGTTIPVMPGGPAQGGTYWQAISTVAVAPGTTSISFELARLDVVPTIRTDSTDPLYFYVGTALPGSLTADAVWRILRVTAADFTVLYADGDTNFDNVWDSHAALSYS
jgi:hypothetical protein